MEGVFAPQRPSHPFRIIENDAISIQSMTSLGRVGRILAGSVDASVHSIEKEAASTNPPSSSSSSAQTQDITTYSNYTQEETPQISESCSNTENAGNVGQIENTFMFQGKQCQCTQTTN